MELYDLINIQSSNIENNIKESIRCAKEQLTGLTTEQTCLIYTSYVYRELRKRHIVSSMMDTQKDFKMDYKHLFIAIPQGITKNYIIDLTYNQFKINEKFNEIYEKGYQLLNNDEYKEYLNNIEESTKHKSR